MRHISGFQVPEKSRLKILMPGMLISELAAQVTLTYMLEAISRLMSAAAEISIITVNRKIFPRTFQDPEELKEKDKFLLSVDSLFPLARVNNPGFPMLFLYK